MTRTWPGLRWLQAGFALGVIVLAGATPASASVEGPCTASFNGVEVERIDSLASPLELTVDDVLTFHGTDDAGTVNVGVELVIASVRVDEGVTAYGPTQNEFTASIDLEDVAPYGVGLFRARGSTDNCTAEVWIRIGGRLPLSTLTGITGLGLALGGVTGQLASIASRRRLSWITAAIAGIATGLGGSVLGQQYGRLQLSYVSIAVAVAAAAMIGAVVAFLLRSRPGGLGWIERRRFAAEERREHRDEARLIKEEERSRRDEERARRAAVREQRSTARDHTTPTPPPGRSSSGVATRSPFDDRPVEHPVGAGSQATARPAATPEAAGPYWCYVMSSVDVLDLKDPSRTVAVLSPGHWYLARREAGEWAHVATGGDVEGWVPRASIHRQG